jgi:two-component system nitrate/nitrite response regulator NarL
MGKARVHLVNLGHLVRIALKALLDDDRYEVCLGDSSQHEDPGCASPIFLYSVQDASPALELTVARLRQQHSDCRIVVMAPELDLELLSRGFDAGVDGMVLDQISPGALKLSLGLVLAGEKVFPTQLAQRLREPRSTGAPRGIRAVSDLSPRDVEILRYLVVGEPNKVIAHALGLSEGTVKMHVKGMLRKLKVANRTQAALWAWQNGVQPTDLETVVASRCLTEASTVLGEPAEWARRGRGRTGFGRGLAAASHLLEQRVDGGEVVVPGRGLPAGQACELRGAARRAG